jgi:uncharacterized protein YegJ (DUF2314 family)
MFFGDAGRAPTPRATFRVGGRATFRTHDAARISDWMFLRHSKIVGGETIRPMLKSPSKRHADALHERLERP